MKRLAITGALAASIAVSGCATTSPYGYNDPYYNNGYNNQQAGRAATGAAAGAVAGGVLGAVVPGVSTVEGAVAGAVLGGVLGAVVKGQQQAIKTIDLSSLNAAVDQFNAAEGRLPKDLDELVQNHYIGKIPAAPIGKKIVYDASTGQVKIVPQ